MSLENVQAQKLKIRLQLAYYKLKTNQACMPLSLLEAFSSELGRTRVPRSLVLAPKKITGVHRIVKDPKKEDLVIKEAIKRLSTKKGSDEKGQMNAAQMLLEISRREA